MTTASTTFLPLGDTARWYMPGRTEFHGTFSLSDAEFEALQSLFPLVAQVKAGRHECTCLTKEDAQQVSLVLSGIRAYAWRSQPDLHRLNTPLTISEAEFITAQLPAHQELHGDRVYLSLESQSLLYRAQVLVQALRFGAKGGE